MSGACPPAWERPRRKRSRALFVAGLLLALIHGGYQCRQSLHAAVVPVLPPAPAPVASTPPLSLGSGLAEVAEMHLFGVYRAAAIVAAPPPVVVPETPLAYRLQGVFTSSSAADSAALIATGDGSPSARFGLGDRVGPEAELVSVALDHVVLRRAGELQRLSLHKAASARRATAAAVAPRAPRGARRIAGASAVAPASELARESVVMARLRRLRGEGV